MMKEEHSEAVENEWFIIRYSGEIPEIAYHSAIYYLSSAKAGPQIKLDDQQLEKLKIAAVDRYREIVLRDLQHANSYQSIYRGVARSIVNYNRFCCFCLRQQLEVDEIKEQAAEALKRFLDTEMDRLQQGGNHSSIINCSFIELQNFAALLEVEWGREYEGLKKYCA